MSSARRSLETRLLVGGALAVSVTVAAASFTVHRAASARLRSSGESSMRTVLETSAPRAICLDAFGFFKVIP